MFNKQIDLFKKMFKSEDGNEKKKIENLVFFLIILIITIIAINLIWNENNEKNRQNNSSTQLVSIENIVSQDMNYDSNEYNLQNDLKNILKKINGVGQVEVLITYKQTSELIPLYNENMKESITEEKDTTGGVRTIEQKDNSKELVYKEQNGEKEPITQKLIMPEIEGAIILAQGAKNAQVKNDIIQAVEAVTGISSHKIQVFELRQDL